jgi:hypothetical protein
VTAPDRRSRFRRPPSLHRPPAAPAPATPEEVLERAPDVSRETSAKDAESAAWAALGHLEQAVSATPEEVDALQDLARELAPAPPLRKDQVARLEALTADWERRVRLEDPPDATLLYFGSPPPPPPVRVRPAADSPAPASDPAVVAERSRQLLEEEAAREARAAHRPPEPAPSPAPGPDRGPAPARVSDWTSRHDPRSLEYPVRARLARAVPLTDVSLPAGPVLDQGTTPPLTVRDASACVGMACTAAANVLRLRAGRVELLEEDAAHRLYARAQDLDAVRGHDYAGTSVLAGLKAGQEAGLWAGYLWALGGTKDVAQVLLQLRVAVVLGLPWSTALEDPDRFGVIRPGGVDAGGHCLAVVGLRLGMLGGSAGPWFELQQSRGPAEGNAGRVYMHHTALGRLLAGVGEAGVPLPKELLT